MKKFIFRRPFITNRDRRAADELAEISDRIHEISDICYSKGDNVNGRELLIESIRLLHAAVERLGFRNWVEMDEYRKRHGKI